MKTKIFIMAIFTLLASFFGCSAQKKPHQAESKTSFYKLKMVALQGDTVSFDEFHGKKVLIVNTASKCGYTPQYEGLEELHQKYGDKLVVVGFPANDFMKQEPGSNEEIAEFCEANYGVSFLMSKKISVKGDDMSPVYKWLTEKEQNGWNTQKPKWNFQKYLVDENGELIAVFAPKVKPLSDEIITEIEK